MLTGGVCVGLVAGVYYFSTLNALRKPDSMAKSNIDDIVKQLEQGQRAFQANAIALQPNNNNSNSNSNINSNSNSNNTSNKQQ